jgi:membrane protein
VLLIVVAVAGLIYGEDAARNAVLARLTSLMGGQSAGYLQTAVKNSSSVAAATGSNGSGWIATAIGLATLVLTAGGIFGEMKSALNAIWGANPEGSAVKRVVQTRIVSLLLVVSLGLLLVVLLVLSALVAGLNNVLSQYLPFAGLILQSINFLISLLLLCGVIGAVFIILPDRSLHWRDVAVGALVTALLITIGKMLIGIYIGRSVIVSSYGAAGSVLAALFWVYYSAQMFLLGAEFTHIYAGRRNRPNGSPDESTPPTDPEPAGRHRSLQQVD